MGVVFLLVVGAILGWLAAIIVESEDSGGMAPNLVAGIGGALIAGLGVTPLVGRGNLLGGNYSVTALVIALLGSILLLLAVNLWRGRALR